MDDEEEDEGEQFDFDSGDEIPEADRQALAPPHPGLGSNIQHQEANATGKSACQAEPPLGYLVKMMIGCLFFTMESKYLLKEISVEIPHKCFECSCWLHL